LKSYSNEQEWSDLPGARAWIDAAQALESDVDLMLPGA
jgi:hypothetical protein